MLKTLEAVGKARTAAARGESVRRENWIPGSLAEAKKMGVEDPELLEAVDYYQESKYKHPRRTNKILFESFGHILGFDAFHLVPELLIQPLYVIVGSKQGKTGQFEAGKKLYELSPAKDKSFHAVEGAGHYDMYFVPKYVDEAIEKLVGFYKKHLI